MNRLILLYENSLQSRSNCDQILNVPKLEILTKNDQIKHLYSNKINYIIANISRKVKFSLEFNEYVIREEFGTLSRKGLRVVQTQSILFLKSISERGGSDRERL